VTSWTDWYIQAILQMAQTDAKKLLARLLSEPEYEESAAGGLFQLARTDSPSPIIWPRGWSMRNKDFSFVWKARSGESEVKFGEPLRTEVAQLISRRIDALRSERATAEYPEDFDHRLRALANVLAELDGKASAGLILEILNMPEAGKYLYSGWSRIYGLEALLMQGVVLPAEKTWEILEPVIQRAKENRWNNQELGLLTHAVCIGLFTDNPHEGVARAQQFLGEKLIHVEGLRSLTRALGNSRAGDAAGMLQEIVADKVRAQYLGDEWIGALAQLDTSAARNLLLSFIDPSLPSMPQELIAHYDGKLVGGLVSMAQRDPDVRRRIFSVVDADLSPEQAKVLGKVLAKLGTAEALMRALDLLKDDGNQGASYELYKSLEEVFVEHRPLEGSSNAFTMLPRSSNAIRRKLLDMVRSDPKRQNSALALLNEIEEWRMRFGRPDGEPRSPIVEAGFFWPPEVEAGH
jgi:hypothetical protein